MQMNHTSCAIQYTPITTDLVLSMMRTNSYDKYALCISMLHRSTDERAHQLYVHLDVSFICIMPNKIQHNSPNFTMVSYK